MRVFGKAKAALVAPYCGVAFRPCIGAGGLTHTTGLARVPPIDNAKMLPASGKYKGRERMSRRIVNNEQTTNKQSDLTFC